MSKTFAAVAIIMAALAAGATLAAGPKFEKKFVEPEMTGKLNLGKMAFDRYCAACHGANGVGTDKGPTFIDRAFHPGHHPDGAFFAAARRGARQHDWNFGDMKPIEEVTDAQLKNIVAYVRAFQKANGVF